MMNNCDLTSSRVQAQRETNRGTKRPHISASSSSSQAGRPDSLSSSDVESEGRSPRRMRMSPTHAYGGGIADLNMQVMEIQNAAAPRTLEVYAPPAPLRQLQPRPAPRPLDVCRLPAPPVSQSLPQTQPLPLPLPLPSQRWQQKQRTRHRGSPPLVYRPGKRTVYVQDMVFKLLVMSQLETSN